MGLFLIGGGVEDLSLGPDDAAGDFVANLDHVGHRRRSIADRQHRCSVVVNLLLESVKIQPFPGGGRELLAGVGPSVGIVNVEEKFSACGFDALGEGANVIEVLNRAVAGLLKSVVGFTKRRTRKR